MNLSPTWRAKFDEKIETSHFKIYLRSVPRKTHFNQNIYFRHIYLRYLVFPSKKHPLPHCLPPCKIGQAVLSAVILSKEKRESGHEFVREVEDGE